MIFELCSILLRGAVYSAFGIRGFETDSSSPSSYRRKVKADGDEKGVVETKTRG